MRLWEEYTVCPEEYQMAYTSRQCEHEIYHDGSHVYTEWHSESVWYGDRFYEEAVPDGPVFWDTELHCPENALICADESGTFTVNPACPDDALVNLLMHVHNVHGIPWLTALDSIQNEITAWKVVPA